MIRGLDGEILPPAKNEESRTWGFWPTSTMPADWQAVHDSTGTLTYYNMSAQSPKLRMSTAATVGDSSRVRLTAGLNTPSFQGIRFDVNGLQHHATAGDFSIELVSNPINDGLQLIRPASDVDGNWYVRAYNAGVMTETQVPVQTIASFDRINLGLLWYPNLGRAAVLDNDAVIAVIPVDSSTEDVRPQIRVRATTAASTWLQFNTMKLTFWYF